MNLTFTRATRAQVPLKLGIVGPSGSGKTTAALKLTRGLVGAGAPIALLDTENGSASLYADLTEFDVLNMNSPYQVPKFIGAIDAAVEGGYKALIIDSASHEWIQILQDKEALDARGGNQWTNWAGFTKLHEQLLTAIRTAPIHLVLCLRAKEKHEMNDQKKVVKLGMGSQMRDGFEYELTTVFDLAMDHTAKVSKDRTRLFDGRLEPITEKTGQELAAWLTSGKALAENTGEGFSHPDPKAAALAAPAETIGDVVANVTQAVKDAPAPVSTAASDFVDGLADGPTPRCTPEECVEITDLAVRNKINLAQLGAYMVLKGYMKPKDWTSITKEGHGKVLPALSSENGIRALKAHLNQHFTQTAA